MKKTLVAKLALAGTVGLVAALASGTADAACNSCHTMHNSQNGTSMRYDSGNTPLAVLLRGTCYSCHSGQNTLAAIATQPPKVFATSASPNYTVTPASALNTTLAGGDFYWVGKNADAKGHNVVALVGADAILADTPPGGTAMTASLECAGATGCHGLTNETDPLTAMNGAHHSPHNNQDAMNATTVGNSFRYLYEIQGREDTDWEFSGGAADHNQYVGLERAGDGNSATRTLSGLCARCHGSYHNVNESGSDQLHGDAFGINDNNTVYANGKWIRHPTDFGMDTAATTEFSSYIYTIETPVGRVAAELGVSALNDVSATNLRVVLCVSCHRAHGSPYDDLLRFNYDQMNVGAAANNDGCFRCHSDKNG